ncbi:spore protease YyaC [Salipaludibacillus sp. HK11]|uniref:spore protease YyaC n=1 Tax=Salipaludibacillus sp. HK11 TaxID=3394320 RepID=UPI0039FBF9F8
MMVLGQVFQEKYQPSYRVHLDEPLAVQQLSKAIFSFLPTSPNPSIAVVCIGSDRSTGDSLGPLIGSKLLEKRCPIFSIYGSLNSPVHAKNLHETIDTINQDLNQPWIIAIDACLGRTESVGFMTVSNGPVFPGVAVRKNLPPIGNIHLTGIVNVSGYMEMLVLQNTRLSLVMNMADSMSRALWRSACWLENRQNVLRSPSEKKLPQNN